MDWLIDWSIDWLIDWLIEWVIDRLIDRLIDWLIDWLITVVYLLGPRPLLDHESQPVSQEGELGNLAHR